MKNYDLLIHALFTASVGDAARAMSIEDEQHNKKSILTHPFFHTAFPAGEEDHHHHDRHHKRGFSTIVYHISRPKKLGKNDI